ncbi:hypothetical protein C8F01DRAFT_1162572 [Mycena amicta]|nr:hypothetical protein C8F01DRAFT_1162572 [Mycena amicta]
MDPPKLSNLSAIENWSSFEPDMKGYLPPQNIAIWPDCKGVKSQLRHFTSTDYMRDNDAPFIASSTSKGFPATRVVICDETFAIPMSSRDFAFLASRLEDPNASRHAVPAANFKILGDKAKEFISSNEYSILRKLKTYGECDEEATLERLDLLKAGSHNLETAAKDNNHYATIFVILPTFTDSTVVSVRATHASVVSEVSLPKPLSESISAVGIYAGISNASIEVSGVGEVLCLTYHVSAGPSAEPTVVPTLQYLSGALPPLRDGFCLWRYRLSANLKAPKLLLFFLDAHPDSASKFTGDDATLLCHLAPLAKAYGFNMYIGRLTRTLSTTQEVYHPYKEYLGLDMDFDPSVLEMPDDADVDYEWGNLRSLGGVAVTASGAQAVLDRATRLVKTDSVLKDQFEELDIEEEHEIEDDGCYFATVSYEHIRSASFLFIAP